MLNREKYIFCVIKLTKSARPLCRPKTNHTCHQKQNQSRETVPLKLNICCILHHKNSDSDYPQLIFGPKLKAGNTATESIQSTFLTPFSDEFSLCNFTAFKSVNFNKSFCCTDHFKLKIKRYNTDKNKNMLIIISER